MIRIPNLSVRVDKLFERGEEKSLEDLLKGKLHRLAPFTIHKKSIDARDKSDVRFVYTLDVDTKNKGRERFSEVSPYEYKEVPSGERILSSRPVIIGAGPSGLFAALKLSERGYQPILFEQGDSVEERVKAIEAFERTGILDTKSNIQFGEGGAGTFSDGKLTTQIKDARIPYILNSFIESGAPEEIRYLSKPHVGTDILRDVVIRLRKRIVAFGGEVHFRSELQDIEVKNGKLQAVIINGNRIPTEVLVLALGHSARDTFFMLHKRGLEMINKPFSVGVRIEHLQEKLNRSQYGDFHKYLGAADYSLVQHIEGKRSVYSFCMCPGGEVVAATSEEGRVVTNGMSYHARNGENANSALLVNVDEKDFGSDLFSGIHFQRALEKKAFELGGGDYRAPFMTAQDLLTGSTSATSFIKPTYPRGVKRVDFKDLFIEPVYESLRAALPLLDLKLRGFSDPESILTGVESRSSSPIRMLRNEKLESNIQGIYPVGEGAGHAGGIMSSCVDGLKAAESIIAEFSSLC
ncbi:NAD(P)/FAD-dependent oxidoreductase [Guggenheimella bovis]